MTNTKSSTSHSNSNTRINYTRTISVPSITLNTDDFKTLISILEKTGQNPALNIVTRQETLTFIGIQSLATDKWPANIKHFGFRTGFSMPLIHGYIRVSDIDPGGFSTITLESNDRDWISAREYELKRFLDQHRNWHHIFHNLKYTFAQGSLLFALLLYSLATYSKQQDWGPFTVLPMLASAYAIWAFYGTLLPKVFPYCVLEPEHPSFYTRLRKTFKFLILAIFATLLGNAIFISFA